MRIERVYAFIMRVSLCVFVCVFVCVCVCTRARARAFITAMTGVIRV